MYTLRVPDILPTGLGVLGVPAVQRECWILYDFDEIVGWLHLACIFRCNDYLDCAVTHD